MSRAATGRARRRVPGIAMLPLPAEVPPFDIDLLYTRRGSASEAVRWLLALITEVGEHIDRG